MKDRSTQFLLIGILVLGAFIGIQETWRARVPSKEYLRTKLFDIDGASLVSIEFKLTNTAVNCVKEGDVWVAGDPSEGMGRADVALLFRMVSGLNSMGKGTTITAKNLQIRGLNASEYGFDEPVVKISAVDNQGRRNWVVGRKTPLGDMVYVKEAGKDEIYTVPDQLLSIIPSQPDQLRDRIVFSGEAAGVRRIEIRGPGGFIQLVKDPQTGWRIQQPVSAVADQQVIGTYIESLQRLRVEDFVADNVSDFSIYGLQGESRQIAIEGSDGTSRMLVLGDDIPDHAGRIYARRADDTSVFMVKADVRELLSVESADFRDVRVLSIDLEDITSVVITKGTEQVALDLEPSRGWKISKPVVWGVNLIALTELMERWDNAVIIEHEVPANASAAEWVFEFASSVSGKTNTISVLPTFGKKDGLLVRRDGDSALFQINLSSIPDSTIDPLTYKDRWVWQLERDEIQSITAIRSGQESQAVARAEGGGFFPVDTLANQTINAASLSKVLSQLSRIYTLGYIAYNPRDLGIYGLAEPVLELHVGLSGTNELGRVLLIGSETPDGFYSMVKGSDVVFCLDSPTVNALSSNLLVESGVAE